MSKAAGSDRPTVFAIDDDASMLEMWKRVLAKDFDVQTFDEPLAGLAALRAREADVVLLDYQMPGMDGLTLLSELRASGITSEVVMVTGAGTIEVAVKALKLGAFDFLSKPLDDNTVALNRVRGAAERRALRGLNASLKKRLEAFGPDVFFVGESPEMRRVSEFIAKVARGSAPVLICGESGTGKELAARAVVAASDRATRPFITLNCAAVSETLIDSELFGHEKGSFTGAVSAHRGLFEAADGGTLFLDELGELPKETQAKLLRALQEGEIRSVGSTKSKKVDVRIIAATNVDLEKAIKSGAFREDLYYRINTFRVDMPPLRKREQDIALLAQHLLGRVAQRNGLAVTGFTEEALAVMMRYGWPGNVRQLNNAVEYAATLAAGALIDVGDLPSFVAARKAAAAAPPPTTGEGVTATPYSEARARLIDDFDVRYLTELMTQVNGNISEAARRSGIDRANLRRMMVRLDLDHLRRQTPQS